MTFCYDLCHTPAPEPWAAVDEFLDAFNHAHGAIRDSHHFGVMARDAKGVIVGGAVGRSWGQNSELQQLAIASHCRGLGVGTQLMDRFEAEASSRGCTLVYLDTFSFQAPAFYGRRGYRVVHETPGFTHGIVKFTMHKRLLAA